MPVGTLADLVLAFHFGYVAFVVLPVPFIILGRRYGWTLIRNNWLRTIHLSLLVPVVLEVFLNDRCPLTLLEHRLRHESGQHMYQGGCVHYWMGRLVHFTLPPWTFSAFDVLFALLVIYLYWRIPPAWLLKWKAS